MEIQMPAVNPLSVAEASALLDVDEKVVRKEIEHGIIKKPDLSFTDAVYLLISVKIGLHLAVDDRRAMRLAVEYWAQHTPRISRVELAPLLELHVGPVAADVEERVGRFQRWKSGRVVEDPNILAGDPTIRGTRLGVRKIGEMILRHGDKAIAELREDYPFLTEDDFRFAPRFAKAYPRRGRPPRETSTR